MSSSTGETAVWRAGCGETACPVRWEGERRAAPPTPIRLDVGGGRVTREIPGLGAAQHFMLELSGRTS